MLPGLPQLAADIEISVDKAVYLVSVPVLFIAVGAFIWTALSDAYGRKPALLGSTLIASAAALGGGYGHNFSQLIAARIFQGMAISASFVVAPAVVVDIFWAPERGQKTGVWVQMV